MIAASSGGYTSECKGGKLVRLMLPLALGIVDVLGWGCSTAFCAVALPMLVVRLALGSVVIVVGVVEVGLLKSRFLSVICFVFLQEKQHARRKGRSSERDRPLLQCRCEWLKHQQKRSRDRAGRLFQSFIVLAKSFA